MNHPTTNDEHAGYRPHRGLRPDAPAEVVRSEERLRVATETVAVGRARLVKYVVTEDVTYTVTVRREEARLEFDEYPAHAQVPVAVGPTANAPEVVLHEERVVVTTEVVPVERVRMVTTLRSVEQVVEGLARAERVEVDHREVDLPRRP